MSQKDIGASAGPCEQNIKFLESGILSGMLDGVLRPGGLQLTKRLAEYCKFSPGDRVVDIGCGTGITVEYLRNIHGLEAIGVDVADEYLRQGRKRSPALRLFHADGEEMPFGDQSVAGVFAECSLSVMGNVGKVLSEAGRILVSGGKLAITDLYDRSEEAGCYPVDRNIGFGGQYGNLHRMLIETGFETLFWEDRTSLLKEFVARFIMEHGSAEELWSCMTGNAGEKQPLLLTEKNRKMGYFLLVAKKIE